MSNEAFKFNKNCAKPYEIRSVSPNGVVRTGKKNSRVSYRMKDVREISRELPVFEDFNRETFMQMRNKFRKFDKDVLEILNTTDFIFEDILLLMDRLKNGTMLGTGIEREFIWNKNLYYIKIEMKNIKPK